MAEAWLYTLALHAVVLQAFYLACVWASARQFRRLPPKAPVLPMTVIKPLKGVDIALEENLRSLVEADETGVLQVLFAVEDESDPAHAVAAKVAADASGRDVRVLVTGPPGSRMGKMHNMIEAFKHARHPVVVFSDSDVRADRDLLAETSEAFARGAGAASALPDATGPAAFTDALIGLCFNHYFLAPAALVYRSGFICPFAGSWLALRRDLIERIGGLEPFANTAADDFALGMAVAKTGSRAVLLSRLAKIREKGGTPAETYRHALKWTVITRSITPWLFYPMPFLSPLPVALAACLAQALAPGGLSWAPILLAALAALRVVLAWTQDRLTARDFFPLWAYFILPLTDLAQLILWTHALASRHILWRDRRYRVLPGGRLEPA